MVFRFCSRLALQRVAPHVSEFDARRPPMSAADAASLLRGATRLLVFGLLVDAAGLLAENVGRRPARSWGNGC
jgi:hypothetical protein